MEEGTQTSSHRCFPKIATNYPISDYKCPTRIHHQTLKIVKDGRLTDSDDYMDHQMSLLLDLQADMVNFREDFEVDGLVEVSVDSNIFTETNSTEQVIDFRIQNRIKAKAH